MLLSMMLAFVTCSSTANSEVPKPVTKTEAPKSARVMFYNVENLFDTIDDPGTVDEEFTPGSEKKWDTGRYRKKLKNIAEVIASIMRDEPVLGIGLCEIENNTVLDDLLKEETLSRFSLKYVHEESADPRGIDVAFVYNSNLFTPGTHEILRPEFSYDSQKKSRDILYVPGTYADGTSLHFFINHWPSRRDGVEESKPARLTLAALLQKKINEISATDKKANVIAMGDFNDTPTDESVSSLCTGADDNAAMINLAAQSTACRGTITYDDAWMTFDQILVSQNLQNGKSPDAKDRMFCLSDAFVLYTDKKGNEFPNKTYGGNKYYGGYSDHLAVYTDLYFK